MTDDPVAWDERANWVGLVTALGVASDVPLALRDLAAAVDDEHAQRAYWRLDNVIVVQGSVFEAAPYTVGPLMRTALQGSIAGRRWALELLLQLAAAWGDPDEVKRLSYDPAEVSRDAMRPWIEALYTLAAYGPDLSVRELALEIVALVDDDEGRLRCRLDWMLAEWTDGPLGEVVAAIIARRT